MRDPSSDGRLKLPQVTLCAASSVNVPATLRALEASVDQIAFAACLLLTDAPVRSPHPDIRIVPIARLASSAAYSDFVLTQLIDHVATTHCLVAQWDGHVLDAGRWRAEFLDYDYIGARWPQFGDGHDVGNGGFSLRTRRLMAACRAPGFHPLHPEDVAIGRANRDWLEARGLRFAPRDLADAFAAERGGRIDTAFGYHGVWHMPRAIGVAAFSEVYRGLDDHATLRRDFFRILRDVARHPAHAGRASRLIADRLLSRRRGA